MDRSVAQAMAAKAPPYVCAAGLMLVVGGPWLLPGFIFGTDWPGPRHLSLPNQVSSDAPFQVALVAASAVLGAEFATKLVILGSLFLAAFLAFRALPVGGLVARSAAATIYTANPFVYGRLHYGQIPLIAAYALLPFFAIALRGLVLEPGPRQVALAAISLTVIGILDLHMLLPAGVLAIGLTVAFALARFREPWYLVRLAIAGLSAAALTLLASAYWLIPLLTGTNLQGQQVAGFGGLDLTIFRTVPDAKLGLLPNVLGLYGFWAENVNRFPSMKGFVPLWPVVLGLMLALAGLGVAATLIRPDVAFLGAPPWVLAMLIAGGVAVILEMGYAELHIRPLILWLDASFPAYRGMRDAGKWASLIALAYAQLAPLGVQRTLEWVRRPGWGGQREVVLALVSGLLLALPVYYGNGMLFGMHGEVQPSAYPSGWYQADRILAADPHPGKAVFLPWHLYLRFSFIRNTNAVIATPAPSFFSIPIVVSADAEVPGLNPTNRPDQAAVESLISAGKSGTWAKTLAAADVKYVLLAREVDWNRYGYLGLQDGLVKVGDFGSIILYRNVRWH